MAGLSGPPSVPAWARVLALALAAGLGGLFAAGVVIAVTFEVQGFGGDGGAPRPGYLLALAVGFGASLALPALVARWVFPEQAGRAAVVAIGVGIVGAMALLGLSLTA